MTDKILEALAALDATNDDHWTTEGLPRLDVVKNLVGVPVSRADITSAAVGFSRATPELGIVAPEESVVQDELDTKDESELSKESDDETFTVVKTDVPLDVAIEEEYEASLRNLTQAQARRNAAVAAMDELILRRQADAPRSHAETVKEFQASQRKQRERAAEQRKAMAEAMKVMKVKY